MLYLRYEIIHTENYKGRKLQIGTFISKFEGIGGDNCEYVEGRAFLDGRDITKILGMGMSNSLELIQGIKIYIDAGGI